MKYVRESGIKKKSYFLFLVVPFIFLCVICIALQQYYLSRSRTTVLEACELSLSAVSNTLDARMKTLLNMAELLKNSQGVAALSSLDTKIQGEDLILLSQTITAVHHFNTSQRDEDHVFILIPQCDLVVSSAGTNSIDGYLSNRFGVRAEPFVEMLSKSGMRNCFLPPMSQNQRLFLPYAMPISMLYQEPAYLIINISVNGVMNELAQYLPTTHSEVSVKTPQGIEFGAQSASIWTENEPKDGQTLQYERHDRYIFKYKSLMSNILKWEICLSVPKSDIAQSSYEAVLTTFLVGLVSIAFSLTIFCFANYHFLSPIERLLHLFNEKQNRQESEFDYLQQNILSVLQQNREMNKHIQTLIPFATEQYLLREIEGNTADLEQVNKIIYTQTKIFEKPAYTVMIVQLCDRSGNETLEDIEYERCYSALKHAFQSFYSVILIKIKQDMACLIINHAAQEEYPFLIDFITQVKEGFDEENGRFTLLIGIGECRIGENAINMSYREAFSALSAIHVNSTEHLQVFKEKKGVKGYCLDARAEEKVRQYLQYGKQEELMQLVRMIRNENLNAGVDEKELKNLYAALLRAGEIVINRKKLSPHDVMGDQQILWDERMSMMRSEEMYQYLLGFYQQVAVKMSESMERSNAIIEMIIRYLHENYRQDLCLSSVSEKFGISVSYLTRLCKEYTGDTFQNYLTHIRISHACELLKNTNATIDMISEQSGFASKFTFLRAFKKSVGLTPTEYRHKG